MFSWGQSRYKGWEATGYESSFNPGSWYITLTDPEGVVYDDGVRVPAFTKRRAAKKRIRSIQKTLKKNAKVKDEGVIRF